MIDATNTAKLTIAAFNVGGPGEFTSTHLDTLLDGLILFRRRRA